MQLAPRRAAPEADATRDLYERYARQIYAYCLHQLGSKEEAEDAMQSTFLNAFRGFKRGVDPEFESAWLYKIAQNVCLTRQRSSFRRRRVESPGDLDAMQDILPSHEPDPDELIGLPEALQGLPAQQRRALLLREWKGLSYKEIAEELELTQAAVETLLFRARRSLAAGLTEEQSVTKRVVGKLRAGSDAGSLLALLQTMFSFGGAKVAATVATLAATSVVAATPSARHAVEQAVVPVDPQHIAPRARVNEVSTKAKAASVGSHRGAVSGVPAPAASSRARPVEVTSSHVRPARAVPHRTVRLAHAPTKTPDATVAVPAVPVAAPVATSAVPPATAPVDAAPAATPTQPSGGHEAAAPAPAAPPPAVDPPPTAARSGGVDHPVATSASEQAKQLLSAWSSGAPATEHAASTQPVQPTPPTPPTPPTAPVPPTTSATPPPPPPPVPVLPASPDTSEPTTTVTPAPCPTPVAPPPQGHRR